MSEPTSAPDATPPVPQAPSFTYGEAAPVAPAAPLAPPAYGAVYGAPPVKRRRVWDLVLTVILLVVGVFGMSIGLLYASIFADPALIQEAMDQAYGQSGLGGWNGSVGAAPAIIAISHVVLYLVALGVSILLLVKNKIAFWVPLSAGVIAAIVFWGTIAAIVLSDPSFMSGTVR